MANKVLLENKDNEQILPIAASVTTLIAPFTDFTEVAENMNKYAGNWLVGNSVKNLPINEEMLVNVFPKGDAGDGIITAMKVSNNERYDMIVKDVKLTSWKKLSYEQYAEAVIKYADGMKGFSGQEIVVSRSLDIITISGAVQNLNEIEKWYGAVLFTLPVGFRPSRMVSVTNAGSYNATFLLQVNTNGDVNFGRYLDPVHLTDKNVQKNAWLNSSTSFTTKDDFPG